MRLLAHHASQARCGGRDFPRPAAAGQSAAASSSPAARSLESPNHQGARGPRWHFPPDRARSDSGVSDVRCARKPTRSSGCRARPPCRAFRIGLDATRPRSRRSASQHTCTLMSASSRPPLWWRQANARCAASSVDRPSFFAPSSSTSTALRAHGPDPSIRRCAAHRAGMRKARRRACWRRHLRASASRSANAAQCAAPCVPPQRKPELPAYDRHQVRA